MRARRIGVATLLVLATLLWTAAAFGVWAKRQALDTDNWVDTSSELLENESVRTALGFFIVDKLFQSADVQASLEERLPPQLQQLAGPAAAGLKEVARRNAPRLLGSAVALEAWRNANEVAHGELIDIVEGTVEDRGVALDLRGLFEQVAEGAGLPAGVADRLPPEVASLSVAKPDEVETVQSLVDLFETLVWVLVALAIAGFAGAIALSPDRRRAVVRVGGCLIFAALLVLAARRLGERWVLDTLADAPNASAAADDAWEISTALLAEVAQGSFLIGLFIVAGAWLAGAGRRAGELRRFLAYSMREHPGRVQAGLGVAILLLVIWGPVPWTQRPLTILVFTIAAFAWLEWIKRRIVAEFPDEPAPRLAWRRPRTAT